jgi:phosphoribosylglycinamide formyltransferase-1
MRKLKINKSNDRLIVFASGTSTGGGSGLKKLCQNIHRGILDADIIAVVSNHEHGGVRAIAEQFGKPFIHFPKPWTAERYQKIVAKSQADFVALSGWLKLVQGLDPKTTFNIHPAPLKFGGPGMYGHHAHEAVLAAYHRNEITHSAVTMHFVTNEYDRGPIIFQIPVPIKQNDTVETLAKRVNKIEHAHQSRITNKIMKGHIYWDGVNHNSIVGQEILTI